MDIPAGKVLNPFNLPGWGQSVVRDMLADITGRTVSFTNDANAAALGRILDRDWQGIFQFDSDYVRDWSRWRNHTWRA